MICSSQLIPNKIPDLEEGYSEVSYGKSVTYMLTLWTLRLFKVPVTREKVVEVWMLKNLCLIAIFSLLSIKNVSNLLNNY